MLNNIELATPIEGRRGGMATDITIKRVAFTASRGVKIRYRQNDVDGKRVGGGMLNLKHDDVASFAQSFGNRIKCLEEATKLVAAQVYPGNTITESKVEIK